MKKMNKGMMIMLGVGVLVLLVVLLGVVPYVEQMGKPAYLDVLVEEGGTVKIDGVEYRNGVYEMEPGKYTAKVLAESDGGAGGVKDLTLELDLVRNQTAGVYPYFRNGKWGVYTAEELAHRQGIVGVLPMEFALCEGAATRVNCDAVRVSYEKMCKGKECVVTRGRKAELTEETLSQVQERLAEKGYNLDDYEYVYVQEVER